MTRIKIVDEDKAEGFVREVYSQFKKQMGVVPNVMKAVSSWPELFEVTTNLFQKIIAAETKLPRATKEMIGTVVSELNSCNYCVSHHTDFMKQYGVSNSIAEKVKDDYHKSGLNEKTVKLLEFSEKVSKNAYKVMDEDFEKLKKLGWNEREIFEAIAVVAGFNYINRIVDALGVELETIKV